MDRSQDPSPFAWIFGGAVALVGLAFGLRALREASAPTPETAEPVPPAEVEELIDVHRG